MDTEALLNPADESLIISETMDEEICWAVLDAIKAWKEGLIKDGNDDIDDDAHPIAHKLEEVLASFRNAAGDVLFHAVYLLISLTT